MGPDRLEPFLALRQLGRWAVASSAVSSTVERSDPDAIGATVDALRAGQVVLLPTDTVYGIGVLPSVPHATDALFALKGRPVDVPLAVLVASLAQALELVEPPSPAVDRVVARWWPGPLTLVLNRRAEVEVELGGDGRTVGVRCPDHDFVRAISALVGPLAVTSANRHGEPTPATAAECVRRLAGRDSDISLVVDGGTLDGVASTVVDGTDPLLPVLRQGPISQEEIEAAALP
jgi:tRNA threonylcarbamoyl adenosine modification protein (Sua5/YciO/YrdC/YwlC family)